MNTLPGPLLPACGGTEQPFVVNGRRWLYCWHPNSGKHCYLNMETDIAVWNRSFHPLHAPHLEFEVEAQPKRVFVPNTEPLEETYYF